MLDRNKDKNNNGVYFASTIIHLKSILFLNSNWKIVLQMLPWNEEQCMQCKFRISGESVCMYACMYIYLYVCILVCMYTCMHDKMCLCGRKAYWILFICVWFCQKGMVKAMNYDSLQETSENRGDRYWAGYFFHRSYSARSPLWQSIAKRDEDIKKFCDGFGQYVCVCVYLFLRLFCVFWGCFASRVLRLLLCRRLQMPPWLLWWQLFGRLPRGQIRLWLPEYMPLSWQPDNL